MLKKFFVLCFIFLSLPCFAAKEIDPSKYISVSFDKYENITTYTTKSFGLDTIQPLILKDKNGVLSYTIDFNIEYFTRDWLFIHSIAIYSDGKTVKYEPKTLQRKVFTCSASNYKCNYYEGLYETFKPEEFFEFIKLLSGADVTIKATGSGGSVEQTISSKNKKKLQIFAEFAKTLK